MNKQEWKERISSVSGSTLVELNNQCIIEARNIGDEGLAKDLHWLSQMKEFNDEFEDTPPFVLADMICNGSFDTSDEYYYVCDGHLYSVDGNTIDELEIDMSALIKALSNPRIEMNVLTEVFGER